MPYDQPLSHTKWDCKYHGVCIPTYHRKALYAEKEVHPEHSGRQVESLLSRKVQAGEAVTLTRRFI